jgi:hypothetical protein
MHTIETLTSAELEALALRTATNPILSEAERSAILRGIEAELAKRAAEVRELRAADSNT